MANIPPLRVPVSNLPAQRPAYTDYRRRLFLLCSPDHYAIEYAINPWMQGNVRRGDAQAAMDQWSNLKAAIGRNSSVVIRHQPRGVPDLVFVANAGIVFEGKVVLSRFRHTERRNEELLNKEWFCTRGYKCVELPPRVFFEGAGDALFLDDRLFMGYGPRSSYDAARYLANAFDVETVPLKLQDERFYHLDTCFCPLSGDRLIWHPEAFDAVSRQRIETLVPDTKRYAVGREDALRFVCNAVESGKNLIVNDASPEFEAGVNAWGYETIRVPLDQFLMAGGGARCLVLRLDEERCHNADRWCAKSRLSA